VQKSGGGADMAARVIQEFCSLYALPLHGRDIMANLKTLHNSILVCQNQLHASSKKINNGVTKMPLNLAHRKLNSKSDEIF